jgi:hypothetical protein
VFLCLPGGGVAGVGDAGGPATGLGAHQGRTLAGLVLQQPQPPHANQPCPYFDAVVCQYHLDRTDRSRTGP